VHKLLLKLIAAQIARDAYRARGRTARVVEWARTTVDERKSRKALCINRVAFCRENKLLRDGRREFVPRKNDDLAVEVDARTTLKIGNAQLSQNRPKLHEPRPIHSPAIPFNFVLKSLKRPCAVVQTSNSKPLSN
jgi:hypothetical protein